MKIREAIREQRANHPKKFTAICSVIIVVLVSTYYKLVMDVFSFEWLKAISFVMFPLLLLAIAIIFIRWLHDGKIFVD